MRLPRFSLKTLLFLAAAFAVISLVAVRWPVHERLAPRRGVLMDGSVVTVSSVAFDRPPNAGEFAIRVGVAGLVLLALVMAVGAIRSRLPGRRLDRS